MNVVERHNAEYREWRSAKFPPLGKQAQNIAKAAGRITGAIVNRGKIRVSDEEQARRLAICMGTETTAKCEFFVKNRCEKCGCFVRFKTHLATEHCPIDKW